MDLVNLHPPAHSLTHTTGCADNQWSHSFSPLLGESVTAATDQVAKSNQSMLQFCSFQNYWCIHKHICSNLLDNFWIIFSVSCSFAKDSSLAHLTLFTKSSLTHEILKQTLIARTKWSDIHCLISLNNCCTKASRTCFSIFNYYSTEDRGYRFDFHSIFCFTQMTTVFLKLL